MENNSNVPSYKEKLIDYNINIKDVEKMEFLIMDKIKFDIIIKTPYEMAQKILHDILTKKKMMNEMYSYYIYYLENVDICFSRYEIYSIFDYYIISLACLCLTFIDKMNNSIPIKKILKEFNKDFAEKEIKDIVCKCGKVLVDLKNGLKNSISN